MSKNNKRYIYAKKKYSKNTNLHHFCNELSYIIFLHQHIIKNNCSKNRKSFDTCFIKRIRIQKINDFLLKLKKQLIKSRLICYQPSNSGSRRLLEIVVFNSVTVKMFQYIYG